MFDRTITANVKDPKMSGMVAQDSAGNMPYPGSKTSLLLESSLVCLSDIPPVLHPAP